MLSIHLLSTLLAVLSLPAAPATAPELTPAFRAGASLGNVFSRTIAIHAPGFDDAVHRVNGIAVYRVTDASTARPRLRIDYDGHPAGSGTVQLPDDGATHCFNGQCAPNTDASGLAHNPRL